MKKTISKIAAVLGVALTLLWGPLAQADFVTGNTSLITTKTDLYPLPAFANPNNYVVAADYNALSQAALDLRTGITQGQYLGFTALGSAPSPVNSSNFLWFDSSNKLHFKFGSTDNYALTCTTTPTTVTSNYTVTSSDCIVYLNGSALTITLPTGANGMDVIVKDVYGNGTTHTIQTTGGQFIDGGSHTSIKLTADYGEVRLRWDPTGGQWRRVNGAVSLQDAYANGITSGSRQSIQVDTTHGGVRVLDTATGYADELFQVTNGSGGNLFAIDGAGVSGTQAVELGLTQLNFNGASGRIMFYNGTGAGPTFTTASGSEKLSLGNTIASNAVNPAIGWDTTNSQTWLSVPQATSQYAHAWYGGQTQLALLDAGSARFYGPSRALYLATTQIKKVADPAAPTLATGGTAGSTSYSYVVVYKDGEGNTTLQSATATIATGNATLTSNNYIQITFATPLPGGAVTADVIRTASGGTPSSTGSIYLAVPLTGPNAVGFKLDTGIAASGYTLPTRNTTGDLTVDGQITATGGLVALGNWTFSGNNADINNAGTAVVGSTNATTLQLGGTATTTISIQSSGVNRWAVNSGGAFSPYLDATYDFGSNTNRTVNGYFENIRSGTTANADTAGTTLSLFAQAAGAASALAGQPGGNIAVTAGGGGAGTASLNPGPGGAISMTAGVAGTGGTGNANSGSITLNIPAPSGTGSYGSYSLQFGNNNYLTFSQAQVLQFAAQTGNKVINIAAAATDTAGVNLTLSAQSAGAASASNGTAGGAFTANGGVGAAASTTKTAGVGGASQLIGGTGGAGAASGNGPQQGGYAGLFGGNAGASGGFGSATGGYAYVRGGAGSGGGANGRVLLGDVNTSEIDVGAIGVPSIFSGNISAPHIIGNSSTPTIAAGAGAGTSPTLALASGSNDMTGLITLTVGTSPPTGAIIATITFASTYPVAPRCIVEMSGDGGANALLQSVYTNNSTTNFSIQEIGGTGAIAGSHYSWVYHCFQ